MMAVNANGRDLTWTGLPLTGPGTGRSAKTRAGCANFRGDPPENVSDSGLIAPRLPGSYLNTTVRCPADEDVRLVSVMTLDPEVPELLEAGAAFPVAVPVRIRPAAAPAAEIPTRYLRATRSWRDRPFAGGRSASAVISVKVTSEQ